MPNSKTSVATKSEFCSKIGIAKFSVVPGGMVDSMMTTEPFFRFLPMDVSAFSESQIWF